MTTRIVLEAMLVVWKIRFSPRAKRPAQAAVCKRKMRFRAPFGTYSA